MYHFGRLWKLLLNALIFLFSFMSLLPKFIYRQTCWKYNPGIMSGRLLLAAHLFFIHHSEKWNMSHPEQGDLLTLQRKPLWVASSWSCAKLALSPQLEAANVSLTPKQAPQEPSFPALITVHTPDMLSWHGKSVVAMFEIIFLIESTKDWCGWLEGTSQIIVTF